MCSMQKYTTTILVCVRSDGKGGQGVQDTGLLIYPVVRVEPAVDHLLKNWGAVYEL